MASTRGKKGHWTIAPWAKEYLKKNKKKKQTDSNQSTGEAGDESVNSDSSQNNLDENISTPSQSSPNKISWVEKKVKFVMYDGSEDVKMFSMEDIVLNDGTKKENVIEDERNLNQSNRDNVVNNSDPNENIKEAADGSNENNFELIKSQHNKLDENISATSQSSPNEISWVEKKETIVMYDGSEDNKSFSMEEDILINDGTQNEDDALKDERNLIQPNSDNLVNDSESDLFHQYEKEKNDGSKVTAEVGNMRTEINYIKRARLLGPRLSRHYEKLNEFWIRYR